MSRDKKRCLSKPFMTDLKEGGLLNPLLERVKKDYTLCLEIREDYINIYYRGGNIIKVVRKDNYIPWFDTNYCIEKKARAINELPKKLCIKNDVSAWVSAIPAIKQIMDSWFSVKPKEEREFQQLFLRENNGLTIGNTTDYFVIDIEYDNRCGARFDLVAVEWESEGSVRKLQKDYSPKLTFIEMKYGDSALTGKSGMLNHVKGFKKYLNNHGLGTIRDEMAVLFKQKRALGLIPALAGNKNEIKKFSDETDFVFLLANHDPASSKLKSALDELSKMELVNDLGINLKFCTSNFMGYGLYKQNIYPLAEFVNEFHQQIKCTS